MDQIHHLIHSMQVGVVIWVRKVELNQNLEEQKNAKQETLPENDEKSVDQEILRETPQDVPTVQVYEQETHQVLFNFPRQSSNSTTNGSQPIQDAKAALSNLMAAVEDYSKGEAPKSGKVSTLLLKFEKSRQQNSEIICKELLGKLNDYKKQLETHPESADNIYQNMHKIIGEGLARSKGLQSDRATSPEGEKLQSFLQKQKEQLPKQPELPRDPMRNKQR